MILADLTNVVFHIPAFDVPLPANIAAIVAAHAMALYWGIKLLVKLLAKYEGKYPWIATLNTVLEHTLGNRDVVPAKERADSIATPIDNGGAAQPPVSAKTPNGLP